MDARDLSPDATFNVAASIKMRKSYIPRSKSLITIFLLQCGRIYKDAEISGAAGARRLSVVLQCGRIYKDAEIRVIDGRALLDDDAFNVAASIKMRKSRSTKAATQRQISFLQCGRIYKDAEMTNARGARRRLVLTFNVAASIKMRKYDGRATLDA